MVQESMALVHSDSKYKYIYSPTGYTYVYIYVCECSGVFVCSCAREEDSHLIYHHRSLVTSSSDTQVCYVSLSHSADKSSQCFVVFCFFGFLVVFLKWCKME